MGGRRSTSYSGSQQLECKNDAIDPCGVGSDNIRLSIALRFWASSFTFKIQKIHKVSYETLLAPQRYSQEYTTLHDASGRRSGPAVQDTELSDLTEGTLSFLIRVLAAADYHLQASAEEFVVFIPLPPPKFETEGG